MPIDIYELTSDEQIATLLGAVTIMMATYSIENKPDCPYCGSSYIIRYGQKCNKQRFFCKGCGRTFVTTTHTIMSNSHLSEEVWREVIADTLWGNAIDYTVNKLGLYHQATFDMRHKILIALQQMPEIEAIHLGDVSELDETLCLIVTKARNWEMIFPGPPVHTA